VVSVPIVPLVVVGGAAYALHAYGDNDVVPPTGKQPVYGHGGLPPLKNPDGSLSSGQTIQFSPTRFASLKQSISATALGTKPTGVATSWDTPMNIDPELKKKLDEVEAYAQKAFNDANEVAKGKAADALNEGLKLDPPLTGHEDWKVVASVVGGATGGAIGGYIGGPWGAKIGALAGAYLGVKLADLIDKNWEEVKEWLSSKWGDIKDFASDVYNEVAGWMPW
jgi:hypothetical protein